jgi:hypothetical protein
MSENEGKVWILRQATFLVLAQWKPTELILDFTLNVVWSCFKFVLSYVHFFVEINKLFILMIVIKSVQPTLLQRASFLYNTCHYDPFISLHFKFLLLIPRSVLCNFKCNPQSWTYLAWTDNTYIIFILAAFK